MSCFNCSKVVPKICKADCCGIVPIDKIVFVVFKDRIVEMPIKVEQLELLNNEIVFPITESGHCAFLNKNWTCNIYENRPEICKVYGTIEDLPCPHLNIEGDLRNKKEKMEVRNKIKSNNEKVINNLKKDLLI